MRPVRVKAKKPPKYGNRRVVFEGMKFDSMGEVERLLQLRSLLLRGVISELVYDKKKLHYDLYADTYVVTRYTPDFKYKCLGRVIVEDYKGNPRVTATQAYLIRSKLFFVQYGHEVCVISKQDLKMFTPYVSAQEHLNEVTKRTNKCVRNMRRVKRRLPGLQDTAIR